VLQAVVTVVTEAAEEKVGSMMKNSIEWQLTKTTYKAKYTQGDSDIEGRSRCES
jgi:hypothetical protein